MADNKILAACTPEYNVVSNGRTKLSFNVHLQAPAAEDEAKRSTVALSCVVDTSSSMEGSKLELVKQSIDFILNQMSKRDKLGLVEYNTVCKEIFPLSRTSEGFKSEASRLAKKMRPESRTNLSGGLFLGFEQQQKNKYVDWEPDTSSDEGPSNMETEPAGNAADAASETSSFVDVSMKDDDTFSEASLIDIEADPNAAAFPVALPAPSAPSGPPSLAAAGAITPPAQPLPSPKAEARARCRQEHRRLHFAPTTFGRLPPAPAGLSSGLYGGAEAPAGRALEEDAVRSIFLFTDGLANEGLTRTDKLVGTLGKLLEKADPKVRVCTFGFGDDHSPELLGEVARAGAGTYYYIEKEDGIATAFADALGGLLSVAAQNVTLEFVPAPGVRTSTVHTAFQRRTAGGVDAVAIGDLYAEEGKDILFDVELEAMAGEAAQGCADFRVGTLRLTYLDVAGAKLGAEEVACVVRRVGELPADREADAGVVVQRARVQTARAMQQAETAAKSGNREQAAQSLRGAMAELSLLEGGRGLGEREAQLVAQLHYDCAEAVENVSTAQTYAAKGNKLLWAKMRAHEQQRTCAREETDWEAGATRGPRSTPMMHTYATPKQMSMRGVARHATAM